MDALKSTMVINDKLFKKIKSDDPEIVETTFGKKGEEFFEEMKPEVDAAVDIMSQVHHKFEEVCNFYMLDKNDERRQQSDKFFEFFNEVFDNVQKSFPKVTRRNTMGMNPAMLAELQKRQAKMKEQQ